MIHFRKKYILRGMRAADEAHLPWAVQLKVPTSCSIRLRNEARDVDNALVCEVSLKQNANERIYTYLGELANNRIPEFHLIRDRLSHFGLFAEDVAADGKMKAIQVPYTVLPAALQDYISSVSTDISAAARTFITLIRWRQSAAGTHAPLASGKFEWSFDGIKWRPTPSESRLRTLPSTPISSNDAMKAEIRQMLDRGAQEPIAHELIREALALHGAARSAFIAAFVAIETGIKRHIAQLSPDSEWLVLNAPTPPLEKILTEFLPSIHAQHSIQGSPFPLPDRLIQYFRRRIHVRNDLVHGRRMAVDHETVDEFICVVKDLLYIFDFCEGHVWARDMVSEEMCSLIGWAKPPMTTGLRIFRQRAWLEN